MAQSKRKNIGQDIVWVTNFDCPNTTVWRTIWEEQRKSLEEHIEKKLRK